MFSLIQKILFNTTLFLAILLSNALLMINTDSFYEFEFNKNNTALKTGIEESDLFLVVDNIQDFFNEKSNEKIHMTTHINGIEKKLFNSKEIHHMIDVKNLILNIKFFQLPFMDYSYSDITYKNFIVKRQNIKLTSYYCQIVFYIFCFNSNFHSYINSIKL